MSLDNLQRREVFLYWFEGDGDELPDEQIYFITSADLGYTNENFIAPRKVYAVHDEGARYKANLWCDEDSLVAIDWKVKFPKDPNDQDGVEPGLKSFSLAYGNGQPVGLGILLALSNPPPTDEILMYQAIYAYILSLIADGTIPSDGGGGGTPGAVNSVNGRTGAVTLTKTDVNLGNVDNTSDANKPVSNEQAAADTAVLSFAQNYADGLALGSLKDRGNFDASGNVFPSSGGSGSAGAIKKGDLWTISVGGTLGGALVTTGDVVRAMTNTPGQTAGNWTITENNLGFVPENSASKNASGGYVGLSALKIQFKNALNTFTSFFQNSNTAARTYTFQDRDGKIADDIDLAEKAEKKVEYVDFAGTSLTLDPTHLGKIIRFTNLSDVTLTIGDDLGTGFNCAVRKANAATNKILFVSSGDTTFVFPTGHSKSDSFQNSTVTIDTFDGHEFNFSGATSN